MGEQLDRADDAAVHADRLDVSVGQRLDHRVGEPFAVVARLLVVAPRSRPLGGVIGDRQKYRVLVGIDQVAPPERVRRVERRGGELAGARLQGRALALAAPSN